jgi:hypothetical protein
MRMFLFGQYGHCPRHIHKYFYHSKINLNFKYNLVFLLIHVIEYYEIKLSHFIQNNHLNKNKNVCFVADF